MKEKNFYNKIRKNFKETEKTLAETKPPIVELLKNLETWLNDGEFGLGTSTLTIADCHMMCMFEQLSVSYAFFD